MTHDVVYVASESVLAEVSMRLRSGGLVGIDTEFIRTDTFYPIPALYQLASTEGIWIVDPLAIDDWTAFVDLLVDPAVTKVMHACSEDIEVFVRHFAVPPTNVVDTQVAAGFVTGEFSPGYAALVERVTGQVIEKHETRSDWLIRPLSKRQVEYAAEDVRHLLAVYASLTDELRRTGRFDWFVEENTRRRGNVPPAADEYYRQLSNAWRLDRRALARLKAICTWREARARERDIPRRRVLADDVLLELASIPELCRQDVERAASGPAIRRFAPAIVAAAASADALEENELPAELEPPLGRAETAVVKELKECGREVAARLGIAEELLVRRRDLEACVRAYRGAGRLPDLYRGWRSLVAREFDAILQAAFTTAGQS